MFINPRHTTANVKKIEKLDIPEANKSYPQAEKKEKITLKYIIENKPKNKVVRKFIKDKCGGILDDEEKIFNVEL